MPQKRFDNITTVEPAEPSYFDALVKIGLYKPLDAAFVIVAGVLAVTSLALVFFNLLAAVLVAVYAVAVLAFWAVVVALRVGWFVLCVWDDVRDMTPQAARLAVKLLTTPGGPGV